MDLDNDLGSAPAAGTTIAPSTVFRGLFQRYVGPDDAFLELARLQFERAGMGAELYAGSPADLERDLAFLPAPGPLPTVHLARDLDLLAESGQQVVREFCRRFTGRVLGFVLHDRGPMGGQGPAVARAMAKTVVPGGPRVFLEYAAGLEPERFLELARALAGVDEAGVCLDIGHLGVRRSRQLLDRRHPGLTLDRLRARGGGDPALVADVEAATATAPDLVVELIEALAPDGKPVHFHLHDGHPLFTGGVAADHFGFFERVGVPFRWRGRTSLAPLYGPDGLRRVIGAARDRLPPGSASFTLEIHQSRGSRPLDEEQAALFPAADGDPARTAQAERMNHWLAALAENHALAWNFAQHAGNARL